MAVSQLKLNQLELAPLIVTVTAINLKTVAQTSFYTVPTGKRLIIESFSVIVDSITGAAAMPLIQLGISTSTASILAPVQLDASMNAANARESWDEGSMLDTVIPAGSAVQFGVTTGGASTTHVGTVLLRGVLI